MELNDVNKSKLEELNEMSVTDDGFKDAANAVCKMIETQANVENQEKELKVKIKDAIWKIALGVAGIITPFAINAINNHHDDQNLDKVLEYETTGCVMSQGGKQTLNNILKRKR